MPVLMLNHILNTSNDITKKYILHIKQRVWNNINLQFLWHPFLNGDNMRCSHASDENKEELLGIIVTNYRPVNFLISYDGWQKKQAWKEKNDSSTLEIKGILAVTKHLMLYIT